MASIEAFFGWASRHGASIGDIAWPVSFPLTGRGVATTKAAAKGTQLLSIPESLMVNVEKASKLLAPLQLSFLDEKEDVQIALFLLSALASEASPAAFWLPYVRCLPPWQDLEDMLSEWEPAEAALLDDMGAVQQHTARQAELWEEYVSIVQGLTEIQQRELAFYSGKEEGGATAPLTLQEAAELLRRKEESERLCQAKQPPLPLHNAQLLLPPLPQQCRPFPQEAAAMPWQSWISLPAPQQ